MRVLDPIEFDLVDFLIDDAAGDAEALAGEFEDLSADNEVPPEHVAGGKNEGDPSGRERYAADGDPGGS